MKASEVQSPFDAGTFGDKYFQSVKYLSLEELERRERSWEGYLSYTLDEEAKRMVVLKAIFEAKKGAKK